jgi:uncharacterized protein YqjF (DUF2071 family)
VNQDAFLETEHRPRPLPGRPWWGEQTWHCLAFLHWPVPATVLRPLVPAGLELEEFEGTAWVAVTPFWMSGVTMRGVPPIPLLSRFPELNTRTYVTRDGFPGVWFFSLDAGSYPAVLGARALFHLPYFYARMSHRTVKGEVFYRSDRAGGPGFEGRYAPRGEVFQSRPGSIEHWLTERYCLYSKDSNGRLYRAEINHAPWPLQVAEVEIERNEYLTAQRIPVTGPPVLVHFANRLNVAIWSPEPVG